MSVLIKMDMPKSCPCELVGVGYDLYCSFVCGSPARVKEYDECCQNNTRPAWCPLLEVPAHGRLIDADALLNRGADYEYPLFDTDGSWDCVVPCYDRETIKSAPYGHRCGGMTTDDWNTWAKQTKQHFKIGDICIYSSAVLTAVGLICAVYELFLLWR